MAYKGYAEEEEEEDVEELEEDEEEEEEPSRKRKKRASVYFDEAAEEDEEEEEEEETTMRKRRMRRASEFIDDTAAVASDEEEEEEDEGEDGFLDDRGADLQEEVTTNRMPRRNLLPEDDQQENVEDLENYIKQRYGGGHDYGEYEDGETTEVEQQALLPSIKDPKLWMVRCQVGHEREAAVCLMQKYLDLDTQGQPLLIKSAIALDHLKGLFYVESEKEAYVRQAIKGMRMIFQSKVTLVPIKEMTDVLSVEKKTIDIANNSWVRIKNGLYKGDLAKVMDVDHVKQKVKVLLIPRLDLQALAAKFQDDRDDRDKKKTLRPVPRFFNIDEIRDTRIPMERKRDSVTGELLDNFNGMQFKDGYLYKTVALKSVDTNVVPTFDELQKFQKPGEDGNVDALGLPSSLATKQRGKLMKGDAVVIIEGDLQNLMGTVEKVDEDTVYIRPKDVQLKDTIAVNETQVRKFFSTGEHVKVIRGAHLGSTGMVVKVERHSVVILNDTTKEHIQVFTSDVVESSEVTTGLSKLGDYELHDLVLLDQTTVGVIIRVEPDGCQILKGNPERSEVMTVKQRDMRKKIFDKRANAADGDMNMISLKDIVRVRNGPLKGRQGPVEHIHRGLLFIYDRHHLENGGFFCVHSRSCVALGGTRNGNERVKQLASSFSELSSPSRYLQSPRRTPVRDAYQPQNGFGGRHSFGGQGRRDEGLVGRTVKIRLGPFKGYRGRVKDATITTVRIELESQMKEVTVRRDQLSDIGDTPVGSSSFRESPRYGLGSETPLHPSRTPLHPAFMATPLRDPSATPIHEGMRTPMRDRAWNPHAPMTPLRDNSWDDSNPSTWGASSTQYQPLVGTPSGRPYEAPTPGAGWASTPGPSYSGVSTPSDSAGHSYGNAPSPFPGTPGGPPMTPGAPAFPGTPGQPMTPGTGGLDAASPASGISSHDTESKWGLPDVIVTVRAHGIGVIREVMPDASCKVTLSGDGETVIASHTEMELVLPKKTDRVKIVAGDLRGSTGKLIGVDGVDGIVKMDDTLDIKILDMGQLGKMPA